MRFLIRYRLLMIIYGFGILMAVIEISGRVWSPDPVRDALHFPPEVETALAIWPDEPGADYVRSLEAYRLRFDLVTARKFLERALSRSRPATERILHQYAVVLALMRADSAELNAAVDVWRRNYPDSSKPDPRELLKQPFPEPEQAGSFWYSALAPNGQLLATVPRTGQITIYHSRSSRQTFPETRTDGVLFPLGLDAEGKILATSDADHVVTLWDVETMSPRTQLVGHMAQLCCISFSPDGKTCATGSRDQTARIWEISSGKLLAVIGGHDRPVSALDFSPDGSSLASGTWDGKVRLWNLETNALNKLLFGHKGVICSLAFSPDGLILASGSRDETVRLWDVETYDELRVLSEHQAPVNHVAFSSDNRLLATGSADHTVKLWNRADGNLVRSIDTSGEAFSLGFSEEFGTIGVATWSKLNINMTQYSVRL